MAKNTSRPGLTPESALNLRISLAMDVAEQQLRNGTASSQTINHFLKEGTPSAKLEREILELKKKLLEAQIKEVENSNSGKNRYDEFVEAMRKYSGKDEILDD